jgi:hypothetical protein
LLKEIAPRLARAALVADPKSPVHNYFVRSANAAAASLAIEVVPAPVENAADIERVFAAFARVSDGGLLLPPDITTITHRVVGIGLILLAASIQSLFVVLPWFTPMPILCVSIVVVTALLLHGCQEPILERANPLLENVSENITRIKTKCGQLIDAAPSVPASSDAKPDPLFLISAEGGGIRAAYWTAVSLEELSQSRPRPLLEQTALLSGVSGGSLGLATWLAAQELPTGARLECIHEFLSGDFFTPLIAGLLLLDIPRLFIPKSLLDKHRGDYFEAYIARRWLEATPSSTDDSRICACPKVMQRSILIPATH